MPHEPGHIEDAFQEPDFNLDATPEPIVEIPVTEIPDDPMATQSIIVENNAAVDFADNPIFGMESSAFIPIDSVSDPQDIQGLDPVSPVFQEPVEDVVTPLVPQVDPESDIELKTPEKISLIDQINAQSKYGFTDTDVYIESEQAVTDFMRLSTGKDAGELKWGDPEDSMSLIAGREKYVESVEQSIAFVNNDPDFKLSPEAKVYYGNQFTGKWVESNTVGQKNFSWTDLSTWNANVTHIVLTLGLTALQLIFSEDKYAKELELYEKKSEIDRKNYDYKKATDAKYKTGGGGDGKGSAVNSNVNNSLAAGN